MPKIINTMVQSLVKPTSKPNGRKVWSVDLESVWIPFFTATNTNGDTAIPRDAIGCPLRLQYNPDGSVKFTKAGRPVIRVVKDINDSVRLVRENFIAGLQSYTAETIKKNGEAYRNEVKEAGKAGKPLHDTDVLNLNHAMAKRVQQALTDAENKAHAEALAPETETPAPEAEKELVPA